MTVPIIPDSGGYADSSQTPLPEDPDRVTEMVVNTADLGSSDPWYLVFNWAVFSWVYWFVWMGLFLAYEIPAVLLEKKKGTLPLTRVVRDRLMRKFVFVKLGVLLLIAWLALHFLLPHTW